MKHTTPARRTQAPFPHTDMLIGADFFLAHHVLVASSQRKLYFTYNGGTGFQPDGRAAAATAAECGGSGATAPHRSPPAGNTGCRRSYARRGAAETSRHNYQHAIADLTRACELAPNEPDYFYERGMAYSLNDQGDARARRLRPCYPDQAGRPRGTALARARLHRQHKDADALVLADLDAADRVAASEDATRLEIGALYERAGNPARGHRRVHAVHRFAQPGREAIWRAELNGAAGPVLFRGASSSRRSMIATAPCAGVPKTAPTTTVAASCSYAWATTTRRSATMTRRCAKPQERVVALRPGDREAAQGRQRGRPSRHRRRHRRRAEDRRGSGALRHQAVARGVHGARPSRSAAAGARRSSPPS